MKAWRGIVVVLAAGLGACAGDKAEPRNDADPEAAANAIKQSAHSDARNLRRSSDGVTTFGGGCSSSNPASPADGDGDGFPDVETIVTYTSCVEGDLTFSGTQVILDDALGSPNFEFTSVWSIDASSPGITLGYATALSATGGTSGTFTFGQAGDLAAVVDTGEFEGTLDESHGWDVDYTPDDGAWFPSFGLPLEAGDLVLEGAWATTVDPEDGSAESFTGAVETTTVLRIDPGCASSIVSGVVDVTLAEPEIGTFTVTWTGCGTTVTSEFEPLDF